MEAADVSRTQPKLSDSQRTALVSLLADEDRPVYQSVREKLISFGPQAAEWLRPHFLSNDPLLRRRAQEIVRHFERQSADDQFLSFCLKSGEFFDLEQAAWLLAQTRYPEINVEAYRAMLDAYALNLKEPIQALQESKEILGAINRYLFEILEFSGNEAEYYDPQNSYLNRVLDRRTGNPISLCTVYLLLARRLQLPIAGIGLPGHFICRYQTAADEIYFDPFNRGRFLTKADCLQYLARGNFSLREEHIAPVTSREIMIRACGNLHNIHNQVEDVNEATRFQRYLVALRRC